MHQKTIIKIFILKYVSQTLYYDSLYITVTNWIMIFL